MSDPEIVWEAPPDPKDLPPAMYVPLLAKVMERPGAWARINTGRATTMYDRAKRLRNTAGKSDVRWEFRNGRVEGKEKLYGLWARYRTPDQMLEAERKPKR